MIEKKSRYLYSALTVVIFITQFNTAMACNGAGMTQKFPLALNEDGNIWVLRVSTIRQDFSTIYDSHAYLQLIDQNLNQLDSIWVYDHVEIVAGRNDYVQYDSYQDPVVSVDSIYAIGVDVLKNKIENLTWLTVLGYSEFAEEGESPLTFIRKEEIDTVYDYETGFEFEDSFAMRIDTIQSVQEIHCYGKHFNNIKFLGDDLFGEFGYLHPGTVQMGSCRLYNLPGEGYLITIHLNPRTHVPKNQTIAWNECQQSSGAMCMAAKDQKFSWHHCGQDFFVFLKKPN